MSAFAKEEAKWALLSTTVLSQPMLSGWTRESCTMFELRLGIAGHDGEKINVPAVSVPR